MKQVVKTLKAPIPQVPSSQAFVIGNLIFCSGQIAVDAQTNLLIRGDLKEQTAKALENVKNVLEAAGSFVKHVVKTTNYLVDLSQVADFNEVYGKFFAEPYPPRTVVQVSALARGALVEIEAIGTINK